MAEVYCYECGKDKTDIVCMDCYNIRIDERDNLVKDIENKDEEIEELKKEKYYLQERVSTLENEIINLK